MTVPAVCQENNAFPLGVGSAADGRRRLYLAVAATYAVTLSTGLTCGYSSPALPDIRRTLNITEDDAAWFGSLVLPGGIIVGLLSGQLLGLIGRRGTLISAAAWFTSGWLCLAFGYSTPLLLAGRFLTGGGMAAASLASTVFVSEVAPANLRGLLNTGCNFSLSLGILLIYVLGKWLVYNWLAAACLVPALISGAAFLFYVRESPQWLLQKGRRKEAIAAMQFYRGPRIENEFGALETASANFPGLSLADVGQPYIYKPFLCSLLPLFMQQASAINILIFYSQDVFEQAGASMAPEDCTMIVGGVLTTIFLVATLLADRAGRKLLFVISSAVAVAGLVALGLCFHYKEVHGQEFLANYGWLPLLSIAVYFTGYSLGLGPLPFVFVGELIPLRAKGIASGLCTASLYTFGFLATHWYTDLQHALGTAGTYWMYASILAVAFVFFVLFVPETKGKSLEEIEQLFGTVANPTQLDKIDEVQTCHL
ncbi:facilitated trehalose transporter Tret1-like [Haemaphysalis longicornis]